METESKTEETTSSTEESKQEEQTETTETSSPLEEAIKINAETKEMYEKLRQERERIEKAAGDFMIGGGSLAGNTRPKQKTQEELDFEEAMKIVKARGE